MLFNSLEFLLFFPVVVLVYFFINFKYRWAWLLVASYYFYMNWNPTYAILIFTSTVVTYLSGILIAKTESSQVKKYWVTLSFVLNLSILFFFKYFNFFASTIANGMETLGIALNVPNFDVLLPVGISFYTFQALSYTVDVYRKQTTPEKHFGYYALFVSFFPQLVAGPIERSYHLLPQFKKNLKFDYDRVKSGILLMIWGFFKKLVIADRVAVFVNIVYNNPSEHFGYEVVIATLFFAIQIYCDFSAYSDIAIGSARIMGYDLMQNFRSPYFSKSISEFWHRWHISLSTWFRDYLYIPLGGNRQGKYRVYFNLFIVFFVSGLWHGAAMTFVIWGALHGLYVIVERLYRPYQAKIYQLLSWDTSKFSFRVYRVLVTSLLVCFAWIFFRANSLDDSYILIRNMLDVEFSTLYSGQLYQLGLDSKEFWIAVYAILVLIISDFILTRRSIPEFISKQTLVFRWSFYFASVFGTLIFGYYGDEVSSFIYFQF